MYEVLVSEQEQSVLCLGSFLSRSYHEHGLLRVLSGPHNATKPVKLGKGCSHGERLGVYSETLCHLWYRSNFLSAQPCLLYFILYIDIATLFFTSCCYKSVFIFIRLSADACSLLVCSRLMLHPVRRPHFGDPGV